MGGAFAVLRARDGVAHGYGMDMNGFGGTPAPPGAGNAMSYPFTSVDGGATVSRQVTGQRVWDYAVDGVAHHGMIPDWVADLTGRAPALRGDLLGGAESYLRTMGGAQGWTVQPNLARGRPASPSSAEWSLFGTYAAGRANDGSFGTRWASAWGPSAWWQVDLGTAQQVGRVGVYWEEAYATGWAVQTRTDGSSGRRARPSTATRCGRSASTPAGRGVGARRSVGGLCPVDS